MQIPLYVRFWHIRKVIVFFPNKESLSDNRSDCFRSLEDRILYIPSGKVDDAYEIFRLSLYKYQTYLSEKKQREYGFFVSETHKKVLESKNVLYDAIFWARDRVNMPPKDANPENITQELRNRTWKNFRLKIFAKKDLETLGCNLLLAVAAGSEAPPYMLVLEPKNPPKSEKYALVGKWVTFDAWGIQIKPDTAMLDMKSDMAWAAWVLGVALYLDTLSTLPVDVVIAVGLTENMTGGSAYRPLDIYKAYNGTTVEIHHTDAEGRLVLADVMSYVEETYKPKHLITMATLTGACIHALGYDMAGVMGDDEEVIRQIIDITSPYETIWRLPLTEKMKKSLKTDIADLKNIASSHKAGSSIGWAFLSYFQGKAKLTHIDIAGPAYRESPFGYMPKGWTWWWVKLLSEFLISQQWKK